MQTKIQYGLADVIDLVKMYRLNFFSDTFYKPINNDKETKTQFPERQNLADNSSDGNEDKDEFEKYVGKLIFTKDLSNFCQFLKCSKITPKAIFGNNHRGELIAISRENILIIRPMSFAERQKFFSLRNGGV